MAFLTGCLLFFHYSHDYYNFSFHRVSVVVQLTNEELNSLRGTDLGREETTGNTSGLCRLGAEGFADDFHLRQSSICLQYQKYFLCNVSFHSRIKKRLPRHVFWGYPGRRRLELLLYLINWFIVQSKFLNYYTDPAEKCYNLRIICI